MKNTFLKIWCFLGLFFLFGFTAKAVTLLSVPQGGTGAGTFTAGGILQGDGTGAIQSNIMSGDGALSASGVLTVSIDAIETVTVEGKATETIAMGKAVYISGAVGNNVQFSLADNTIDGKTNVAGVAIESKTAGQTIRVRHVGQLSNFDTSAWADGDDLYLSTAGSLINTVPTSGTTLHVAYVEYSHATLGDILMHVCGERNIGAPASTDLFLRMGDNVGVNKLSYRDYANNEVGYVNSDGNILFPKLTGGTTTTSDLTLQTTSGVGTTGADMHFKVGNNGATEAMTILNNGNVGIGTNAPTKNLDVYSASSPTLIIRDNDSWFELLSSDIAYFTANTSMYFWGNDGYIHFKADGNRITFTNDNGIVELEADGDLTVNTNQLFAQKTTGNVGIGTIAPSTKLEVNGTATATSFVGPLTGNSSTATALAANGANCSAGQYPLGVDASGAVESCTADADTTYVSSDFTHDDLTGFVANEHLDWTADLGATNIHAGNYTDTDTTYTAGRSLTLSGVDILADSELYHHEKCLYFEDPVAADDFKSLFHFRKAATITGMWCESDQTVNMDLQLDDGTPADINGTDLVCDSTPADDTSLGGDTGAGAGERLDLAITSVSGTPTWVSICFDFTYDD